MCVRMPVNACRSRLMAPPNGSHVIYAGVHGGQARLGSDGIYFDHAEPCTDPALHRHCRGAGAGSSAPGPAPTASTSAARSSARPRPSSPTGSPSCAATWPPAPGPQAREQAALAEQDRLPAEHTGFLAPTRPVLRLRLRPPVTVLHGRNAGLAAGVGRQRQAPMFYRAVSNSHTMPGRQHSVDVRRCRVSGANISVDAGRAAI
jgi:hypothetical protein